MKRLWWKVRGELVELPASWGDILNDWGNALRNWTIKHRWAKGEYEDYEKTWKDLHD